MSLMCTKKSQSGTEKIVFLYLYISAFSSLTDRPTNKIFVEYMRGICTEKNRTLSQLGAEKIAFPPKPNGQADGHKNKVNRTTEAQLFRSSNHHK